jgi:hypothetical protein
MPRPAQGEHTVTRPRTRLAQLLTLTVSAALCALSLSGTPALAAGDANEASCPNESLVGFEPYLADCRAYEKVTPGFKAGNYANLTFLAPDGSRAVLSSTGLFAGSEGGKLTALYEAVRSGSGWVTRALDPPSSLFPAQQPLDASADLSRTLWEVHRPSESIGADDLAVREPDGEFVEVGPIYAPSYTGGAPAGERQVFGNNQQSYAGASPDLSHVFFYIQELLWPFDPTQPTNAIDSLYEYRGVGNTQPELVGVDDEGNLISHCGTALGSLREGENGADVYNAISQNGETVFFTAGQQGNDSCRDAAAPTVAEVYARIGGGPTAETIDISEPSHADCEACQTSSRAAAEFQGASSDGKQVFFLTSQEMFKGDIGMNLYEYDFNAPEHQRVLRISPISNPGVLGVARVSEDGSHVYFVAEGVLTGPNREGGAPVAGQPNLYVFERDEEHPAGRLAFVATLSQADGGTGFEGDWSRRDSRAVQATPDGRYLVFQSRARLTPDDASQAPQIFEYDAAREELARVSVGEAGYPAGMQAAESADASIPIQEYTARQKAGAATYALAVSDDGSMVEFTSAGGLTRQAAATGAASLPSVFEYRSAGTIGNGRVYSISNGDGAFGATATGIDAIGTDAFIETLAPVLPSDGDTQRDLYDARMEGGFPEVEAASNCEAALTCQGGLPGAPALAVAGSQTASPGGNASPQPPAAPLVTPAATPSRAQRLAKALKVCKRYRRAHRRRACEVSARKRFGTVKSKGQG